jgi:hypothetical protein
MTTKYNTRSLNASRYRNDRFFDAFELSKRAVLGFLVSEDVFLTGNFLAPCIVSRNMVRERAVGDRGLRVGAHPVFPRGKHGLDRGEVDLTLTVFIHE